MSYLKFTYEELEAAGYTKHPVNPSLDEFAVALWQKRVRAPESTIGWDAGTTLYFINLFEYPEYKGLPQSFMATVNFYGHGEPEFHFEVRAHRIDSPNDNLASIEGFFSGMFRNMLCKPYPHG